MKDKIKFLPLLLLYILIVLILNKEGFWGDEGRYMMYVFNLTSGSYLPDYSDYLWNGPGYPIVLVPFVFLKIPLLFAKLMNSLFLFLAVYFFYLTLRLYMMEKHASIIAYLFGIYPPFMRYMQFLVTEEFTLFLVSCFLFFFCKLFQEDKIRLRLMIISSGFLGYLALTKIFFGYVILTGFVLFLALYIIKRKMTLKKTFMVYLFSIIFCIPYLIYTYSVTGKIYYWGNSGGNSLYWMSTPYENELGDWHGVKEMKENAQLFENHQKIFRSLEKFSYTKRDIELEKRAIENIIHNPLKFIKNWLANIGRLLFNYPYSYTPQSLRTYFYIIPNMFLVVFCILCLYPSYIRGKYIPYEIWAMLVFGCITFLGSSMVSAYNRQFLPLVPILVLWISFTLTRIVKIEISK